MSTQHPLPPKKEVALALLERSSVHLHLDPRVDGVTVPPWLKKQPQLVLQIGLNMPVPIPDLRLDDEGMSCTLSFQRSPFFCVVPWSSIFAMVGEDGRGMVWPDDVPPEVAQQAAAKAADAAQKAAPTGKRQGAAEGAAPSSKPKRPRKKPALAAAPPPEGTKGSSPSTPRAVPAPAPAEAPPTPVQPAAQQRRPGNGGAARKPKRELPPYLRVVK